MKANKKGISLIVLVITIIVIIILAAAVILTLNKNNPIDSANEAVTASDKKTAQEAYTTWIGAQMAAQKTTLSYTGTITTAGGVLTLDGGSDKVTVKVDDLGLPTSIESITIEKNAVTAIVKK